METKPTFLAGALGDSITTAFNADSALDNLALSWSTGSAPGHGSHVARLQLALPHCQVKALNVASAGVRSGALADQARRLADAKVDYATLLIGANDLTDWLLVGEYGASLDAFHGRVALAIDALIAANPRVMILLAAIPDQARVVELALKGQLNVPWLSPDLVKTVKARYAERHSRANSALADVAKGRAANVRFAGAVGAVRFEERHLSRLDFYHPSREGQKRLADQTWNEGWF